MKLEKHTEEQWIHLKRLDSLYSVSNLGRIKSNKRIVNIGNNKRVVKETILNPTKASNGYYIVNLTYPKRKQYLVHRLICEAFYGESTLMVNHKDFDKSNNNIDNLEYCTQKQNIEHSILGERNGQMLLDTVYGIFYNTYIDAANSFNIKLSSLYKMMNGAMINKTNLIKV